MHHPEIDITYYQKLFGQEILSRMNLVDPSHREDWYSLALGWALGKGIEPIEAKKFADYIRYHTAIRFIQARF